MKTNHLVVIAMLAISWGCHSGTSSQPGPTGALRAGDEGMWTLDNLPVAYLKAQYDFVVSPEWVRHVQLSAVRFGGASGAFVSPEGLVLTNHHVALGQLQKLSTPGRNYVRDGFCADAREEELRCPDQELNVLVSMEEVTQRVVNAVDTKASEEQQNRQRKGEMARIEKESTDQTKLRSDVVSLYQGGEYWLYRYKKYTDVRLVMAPELQAAFFGGDYDNFTYPRFCLDFAFFRVYEDGKPVRVEHYLKWSQGGAKEGDLVFVAGHPGSTRRLRTVSQLEYDRDRRMPRSLRMLGRRRQVLGAYAARGEEQARQVQGHVFGVENSLKAITGEYEGLKDPAVFRRLASAEDSLRKEVMNRPELAGSTGGSWDRIAAALRKAVGREDELTYYPLRGSQLTDIAVQIVRHVVEVEKPNDSRYEEFRDSALDSLHRRLYSPAPIYPELEEHLLADTLSEARQALGGQDKLIVAALGGRDPQVVSHELVTGTRLADPAVRKTLVNGGRRAVEQSDDPLIVWARRLDPMWRELRDWQENHLQSVEVLEGHRIARARFAIHGRNAYPDATGTLRLSYGRVMGYESGTTRVPYKTTFLGLLDRAASFDGKAPFNLVPAVDKRRSNINLDTPLNFVTTNDIIGGNSGSPVVNRRGEYVGLIFDGNIQSLPWAYVYSDEAGRAIAVHSQAIVEVLRGVYQASELVKELVGE
ncbi:MAG: S46 family peptidase [Planctomycetota bacterium]|nr:S46 family peptidase [Planctomycetota bacterium]